MVGAGAKLTDKFSRIAALRPARTLQPIPPQAERETGELASLLGATVERNKFGEHLAIRRWFPTPEQVFEPGDACGESALELLLSKGNPPAGGLRAAKDPRQWLFLDTETTGISGGSGMYAFLIGLAWWDSGGFQVEQLFMRDFSEEHALLESLRQRIHERSVLVTYNGKTFDWPLLTTRFAMTRKIETPKHEIHLDFLHAARQIWRPRLLSVRLAELEQHVLRVSQGSRLDWTREGDVDGAMIPQLYFDYVRRGMAPPLLPVFRHNQMDLRGLAAIAGKILELISAAASAYTQAPEQDARLRTFCDESEDLYGLSRLFANRGARRLAHKSFETALAAGLPPKLDRAARLQLARLAKRDRNHAKASQLWQSLLEPCGRHARAGEPIAHGEMAMPQSLTLERILTRHAGFASDSRTLRLREQLEACEQLAIHAERRAHDTDRAIQLTHHALNLLRRAKQRGAPGFDRALHAGSLVTLEGKFEKRLARLSKRARSDVSPSLPA